MPIRLAPKLSSATSKPRRIQNSTVLPTCGRDRCLNRRKIKFYVARKRKVGRAWKQAEKLRKRLKILQKKEEIQDQNNGN